MFTQNAPVASIFGHDVEPLSAKNPTSGGSSDTELNEPTARPTGSVVGGRGDHGDAGGEVAEHLAVLGGVEATAVAVIVAEPIRLLREG